MERGSRASCVLQITFEPIGLPEPFVEIDGPSTELRLRAVSTTEETALLAAANRTAEDDAMGVKDDDVPSYCVIVDPVFDDKLLSTVPELAAQFTTFVAQHSMWSLDRDARFVQWIQQRMFAPGVGASLDATWEKVAPPDSGRAELLEAVAFAVSDDADSLSLVRSRFEVLMALNRCAAVTCVVSRRVVSCGVLVLYCMGCACVAASLPSRCVCVCPLAGKMPLPSAVWCTPRVAVHRDDRRTSLPLSPGL